MLAAFTPPYAYAVSALSDRAFTRTARTPARNSVFSPRFPPSQYLSPRHLHRYHLPRIQSVIVLFENCVSERSRSRNKISDRATARKEDRRRVLTEKLSTLYRTLWTAILEIFSAYFSICDFHSIELKRVSGSCASAEYDCSRV